MRNRWWSAACVFMFHVTLSPKPKKANYWAPALAPQTPLCLGVALECRKHAAVIEVNDCAPPLKRGGTAAENHCLPLCGKRGFRQHRGWKAR